MDVRKLYRSVWCESSGAFIDTCDLVGYEAVGPQGDVLAVAETEDEARSQAQVEMWRRQWENVEFN